MVRSLVRSLAGIAVVLDGLIAGASLDRSIVELPAIRRMGAPTWKTYSARADLGNGRFWYPALAIGGTLLTIAAARRERSLWPSAVLSAAGLLTTVLAGPNVLRAQRTTDPDAIRRAFDRFRRWQAIRASLQALAFGAAVTARS